MRHKSIKKAGKNPKIDDDVIIVGGHHAGLSLAALLGVAGFRVICLERSDLKTKSTVPKKDGRTVALSLRTIQLLKHIGVWPLIEHQACPIHDIRIADQQSPATLDFHHNEVGDQPFGWIIENRFFLAALQTRLTAFPQVRLIAPATVTGFDINSTMAGVTLADGQIWRAPLIVGADGRASFTRACAGIESYGWDYGQTAIICNIAHALPHRNIAVEHFLPGGPFAVLPMTDAPTPGTTFTHRSSIVWTEKTAAAAALAAMPDDDFAALLQEKVAAYLGAMALANARQSYPLQLQHAKTYIAERLVLIGDAAHGIHPIAGQGFNLGMGDIEALGDELIRAAKLGLDPGNSALLRRYQRRRKIDNGNMVLATDLLDRLFSNALPPVQGARRFGLGMVQRLPALKKFFMRTAMGIGANRAAA